MIPNTCFPTKKVLAALGIAGKAADPKNMTCVNWYDTMLTVPQEVNYPKARRIFYGDKVNPRSVTVRPLSKTKDTTPKPEDQFEPLVIAATYSLATCFARLEDVPLAHKQAMAPGGPGLPYTAMIAYMNVWDDWIIPQEVLRAGSDPDKYGDSMHHLLRFFVFREPEYTVVDAKSPKPGAPYQLFRTKNGEFFYTVYARSVPGKKLRQKFLDRVQTY